MTSTSLPNYDANAQGSKTWHERACGIIPGGVSSPVRAFTSVGGVPRYFVRGTGAIVEDVDGREYVDLIGSWGPMIAGHAHPEVVAAACNAMAHSSSFGAPTTQEVLLAEEILQRVPILQRIRFLSSGTEAVMTALRLARAATNRDLIVKFAGCYHGHADALLVQAGSGVATLGLPNSPGVTEGQSRDTIVLPFNDPSALIALFDKCGDAIAAVITEGAAANMGVVPPALGFNELIGDLCRKHGALFILDEVLTGFRVHQAGWWGLNLANNSISPDLFTYGKVIGGGFPLAAVAGSAAIMDLLAPIGPVYQAGTLSGNPVASAAGLATLRLCTPDLYAHLNQSALILGNGVSDALRHAGVPHTLQRAGNLFSIFFHPQSVQNFEQAKRQDVRAFSYFFHAMLSRGVSLPPSAFEAWFVSGAHREREIEWVLSAAQESATEVTNKLADSD
ncbi:MAG: glutamate-1-semialdehyde 2,1-aminomutase [Acidimicrobiaceae bacterium]|nr:glutamate-1-semialdehyde 2,1-aminomutase [Acidimicrobiaceae bacterium]